MTQRELFLAVLIIAACLVAGLLTDHIVYLEELWR